MNMPCWTDTVFTPNTGEDHLGLLSVGVNIAETLVTGINTVTPRARYHAFYSWVLNDFLQHTPTKDMRDFKQHLHRRELAFILANIGAAQKDGISTAALIGVTKGAWIWANSKTDLDITAEYLKNPLGGYAIYRGVMQQMHLIKPQDDSTIVDAITDKGRELADAFQTSIATTLYFRNYLNADYIPREVLVEFGEAAALHRLPGKADAEKLLYVFIRPDLVSKKKEDCRRETIGFFLDAIQRPSGNQLISDRSWRRLFYERKMPDGSSYMGLKELDFPLEGWFVYQLRQYFVFAVETLFCHLINDVSFANTTLSRFLSERLSDTMQATLEGDAKLDFDPSQLLDTLINQVPEYIEEYATGKIVAGLKAQTMQTHFVLPILMLLTVFKQLDQLKDKAYCWELAGYGGGEHISLTRFHRDVKSSLQKRLTVADFCHFVYSEYIVKQHYLTAMEKLTDYNRKLDTFRIIENDGILEFRNGYQPNFNGFRGHQLLQAMVDINLILRRNNELQITDLGQEVLARVKKLAVQVKRDGSWLNC